MNLLVIQHLTDGTIARSFLNYPTKSAALSALYSTLASASVNENMSKCVCSMIDDNGMIDRFEDWTSDTYIVEE